MGGIMDRVRGDYDDYFLIVTAEIAETGSCVKAEKKNLLAGWWSCYVYRYIEGDEYGFRFVGGFFFSP